MEIKQRKVISYLTDKLVVPHERGKLFFQYPSFKGNYGNVANEIDKDNLERPTSSKTVLLLYDAFQNPKGKYESQIIKILNDAWFWEFTGNDSLPEEKGDFQNGVFIQDNPLIVNEKLIMNKNDLIKKMEDAKEFKIKGHPIFVSPDRSVRFIPFGFKIGSQKVEDLIENPYIVARYLGREGNELENSEKLGFIASKYNLNPSLSRFDSVSEEKVRMSALGGGWILGGRLSVYGYDWIDVGDGHSFGVCNSENKK